MDVKRDKLYFSVSGRILDGGVREVVVWIEQQPKTEKPDGDIRIGAVGTLAGPPLEHVSLLYVKPDFAADRAQAHRVLDAYLDAVAANPGRQAPAEPPSAPQVVPAPADLAPGKPKRARGAKGR